MIKYQDVNGNTHISDIIFWDHGDKLAHYLVQYVELRKSIPYFFLADLKTSSKYVSAFSDAEKIASFAAKNSAINLEGLQMSEPKWYYRSGDYSSYDPIGYEDICELIITRNALGTWVKKGDLSSLNNQEKSKLIAELNLASVEEDLAKLPQQPPLDPGNH